MVLVRFAYGFLDRLVPCSLYRLCPFAPPPLQGLLHYYGLLPHGFMSHFLLMRLVCQPTYTVLMVGVPSVVPLFPAS